MTAASTPGSALLEGEGIAARAGAAARARSASPGVRSSTALAAQPGRTAPTDAVDDMLEHAGLDAVAGRARRAGGGRSPIPSPGARPAPDRAHRGLPRTPARRRHPHRHHLRRRAWRRRPRCAASSTATACSATSTTGRSPTRSAPSSPTRRSSTTPSTASAASTRRDAAHIGDLRRTDIAGAQALGIIAVRYTGVFDDPGTADDGTDDVEADVVLADHADLARRARALTGPLAVRGGPRQVVGARPLCRRRRRPLGPLRPPRPT